MQTFKEVLKKTAIMMLVRDVNLPFSNPLYASYEVDLLRRCETELDYLRASRIGKRVKLGREQRISVWATYQRALNHSDYEVNFNKAFGE
jgi:hypothetical protein